MKTTVPLIGCMLIVLFLSPLLTLQASGKPSEEMQKKERMKYSGWIGVMIEDVGEKMAKKEKLDSDEGVYVKEVMKDSPADSAGIREGDIILEYKGKKVFDADELAKLVTRTEPGTKVELVLVRHGQKTTLQVNIGKKKVPKSQMFGHIPPVPDVHVFVANQTLGMHLMTLNEQLGEYFGAPNNEGVLVEEVEKGSTAEKAGVKAGDIIVRVGTKTVDGVEKFQKELRKYDEGDKIDIELLRKGAKKTFSIEMEEDQAFFKNFHFPKHRIRIFRGDPFDDAALRLDMDELRSNVEHAEYELQESLNSLDGIPQDISGPSPRFEVPHREHSKLRL